MVARCLCLTMSRRGEAKINLPHAAVCHTLTLQYHAESNLWTPSQGLSVEVDVYGWYSKRSGEIGWHTDLVQPAEQGLEFSEFMTKNANKTLIDAVIYNLQWQAQHVRPQSKPGTGEVPKGELFIRRITQDVISDMSMA